MNVQNIALVSNTPE